MISFFFSSSFLVCHSLAVRFLLSFFFSPLLSSLYLSNWGSEHGHLSRWTRCGEARLLRMCLRLLLHEARHGLARLIIRMTDCFVVVVVPDLLVTTRGAHGHETLGQGRAGQGGRGAVRCVSPCVRRLSVLAGRAEGKRSAIDNVTYRP